VAEVRAVMPEPDGPQFSQNTILEQEYQAERSQTAFDPLWTATYSPTGGNTHPNPRAAQRVYDFRQDFRRYGNRYSELSERGQQHVNIAINRLASHGGGWGAGDADITRILGGVAPGRPVPGEDLHLGGLTALDLEDPQPSDEPNDRDAYGRSWQVEAGISPDYDQPDPFDRSDPEQDRQARSIEDMNELWEE